MKRYKIIDMPILGDRCGNDIFRLSPKTMKMKNRFKRYGFFDPNPINFYKESKDYIL